jgi:hypothetical protein
VEGVGLRVVGGGRRTCLTQDQPPRFENYSRMAVSWSTGLGQDQPTTHTQTDPFHSKTKVVVVTGIKKNSEFEHRLTLRKKTASPQNRIFQKGSLTADRQKFRVKNFVEFFFD